MSIAEELELGYVIVEGDAQALITQLTNLEDLAIWIIEEEVQFIRSRVQNHANWSNQWVPREVNRIAHMARWCLRENIFVCIDLSVIPWILYLVTPVYKVSIVKKKKKPFGNL